MARKNRGDMGTAPSRLDDLSSYDKRLRKRRRRKILVGVLVTVFAAIVAAGGVAFAYVSHINAKLTSNVSAETRAALALAEPAKPDDPFYMLLLGVDKDEGRANSREYGAADSNYRTDTIMVVRVDPVNVKVTMVSIHRDTLVNLGENGTQKINSAYSEGGIPYTVEVMRDFTGLPISHYAEVDIDQFVSIVDKVGGVDINLPVAVRDPNYTGIELEAGEHHIDGTTAMLLARSRHAYDHQNGDGDVYRAANQRMIIAAILKKVLQLDPLSMADTVATLAESVTTDMDLALILSLAAQMKSLDITEDIYTAMEPTTSGRLGDGTYVEYLQKDLWRQMMDRMQQGLPPYPDGTEDYAQGVAGSVTGQAVPVREGARTEPPSSSSYSSSYSSSSSYDYGYDYSDDYDDGSSDYSEGYGYTEDYGSSEDNGYSEDYGDSGDNGYSDGGGDGGSSEGVGDGEGSY